VTDAAATGTPTDSGPPPPRRSRRRWWIIGGVLAALLVLGGAAIWYFVFRDTAPPAVDIKRASESVGGGGTKTTTADSGTDGTWTVDTSVGSFSDFSSAFVGYRVNEELAGVGAKTAAGRTPDVSGTLVIDGTKVTKVDIKADLTTLQSDESQRDDQIRHQALETDSFPTATFVLTKPIDLGAVPAEGATANADATGKLTLHGVTKDVTIPLQAKLVNNVIVVTGSTDIAFADYGIQKPQSFKVLSVDDHGVLELQLFFKHS
jgi:polyisoprenoid-binding protein YceI